MTGVRGRVRRKRSCMRSFWCQGTGCREPGRWPILSSLAQHDATKPAIGQHWHVADYFQFWHGVQHILEYHIHARRKMARQRIERTAQPGGLLRTQELVEQDNGATGLEHARRLPQTL